jgi:MazG family protein
MQELDRLVEIMARLRDSQTGCPWDLKQTPDSLKEYVVEEAYELLEAIDGEDPERIREELGDLLLQIVFLARLAEEKEQFSLAGVATAISDKLVSRHPHIFGRGQAATAEEVRINWEKIKMAEKSKSSILSDYPAAMPALVQAKRLASQASTVGFDWNDPLQALAKVEEELAELREAIAQKSSDHITEETGDLLFAVANVARLLDINPEFALQGTNRKFIRRFRRIECEIRESGRDIHDVSLAEMEEIWQRSK